LRLIPDEDLYQGFFYYVLNWGDYLAEGGTLEAAAQTGQSPNPFSPQATEDDRKIITRASFHCARALGDMKVAPSEAGRQFFGLTAETSWKPVPPEELRQRQLGDQHADERAMIVRQELDNLRFQLGQTSFDALDSYVRSIYQASRGRLVRGRLTDRQMLANYLHYVAWLDSPLANVRHHPPGLSMADPMEEVPTEEDRTELRAAEQAASGLSDSQEAALHRLADEFLTALLEAGKRTFPPGVPASGPLAAVEAAAAAIPSTDPPAVKERRRFIANLYVDQMKSKLDSVTLGVVEKRAHVLYGAVRIPEVVPVTDSDSKPKALVQR